MKQKTLAFLAALLLAGAGIFAQPSSATLEEITTFVEQARQDWQVPGVAVGIVQGGRAVYTKGFGLRDVAAEEPVTEKTL
ncbi:MAG: serine hydrolase, partial [Phaeodactylibacter sp.]|nr:serine hydrolase [Phaeodactylibacter sp.]